MIHYSEVRKGPKTGIEEGNLLRGGRGEDATMLKRKGIGTDDGRELDKGKKAGGEGEPDEGVSQVARSWKIRLPTEIAEGRQIVTKYKLERLQEDLTETWVVVPAASPGRAH